MSRTATARIARMPLLLVAVVLVIMSLLALDGRTASDQPSALAQPSKEWNWSDWTMHPKIDISTWWMALSPTTWDCAES
jgi:hypothetical protein